ncbi:class I SAM-dependent methyltransferase [Kribbella sp. NPDC051770]|uniref:class I SAM-dependent methyltransferase n=1 Tax=Kribbella sp. NPDC051770 TaxID=3155413 RepID=UPI00342BE99B
MDEHELNRVIWSAGTWDTVAALVASVGPKLLDEVPVGPGVEVLDVATGSGSSVAIPAVQRGATVVASDLTPQHFVAGRRRAAAAGVELEWVEADAEELPFEDGRFDRVFSTFGHMFAPDQAKAGAELVRVCKPGGTIALATWTPSGYAGQLFGVIGQHLPPGPGGASPVAWGEADHVRAMVPGVDFTFHTDSVDLTAPSVEEFAALYAENFGPLVVAREALGPRWSALHDDLLAYDNEWNAATDGSLRIVAEYLVSVGRKPVAG